MCFIGVKILGLEIIYTSGQKSVLYYEEWKEGENVRFSQKRDKEKAPEKSDANHLGNRVSASARDTVIPKVYDAKLAQNLDTAKDIYKKTANKTRGFITDVVQALHLKQVGPSQYGSFIVDGDHQFMLRIISVHLKNVIIIIKYWFLVCCILYLSQRTWNHNWTDY